MAASSSKKVIYAALIGNALIAVTKFVAAAFTGRSAMLSEGGAGALGGVKRRAQLQLPQRSPTGGALSRVRRSADGGRSRAPLRATARRLP